MLVLFEELLRATNPDLEFDITINTDLAYSMLSRAQEEYIKQNIIIGDSIKDQVNAIRQRSDVLRKLITRGSAVQSFELKGDGGYEAEFGTEITGDGSSLVASTALTNYWMFLSGTMAHISLPVNEVGFSGYKDTSGTYDGAFNLYSPEKWPRIELDLIDHYDLQKKVRTVNNEPVFKYIPILLEGDDKFSFYLDKEKYEAIESDIENTVFHINYLAKPTKISGSTTENNQSLVPSTHIDIVKIAVDTFIREYKFLLPQINKKPNG